MARLSHLNTGEQYKEQQFAAPYHFTDIYISNHHLKTFVFLLEELKEKVRS